MAEWVLGERSGLSAGAAYIAAALASQRQRFLAYLRGLDAGDWTASTRCAAWSVHHIARHMVDTSRIDAARLAGRPPVFPIDGAFDPTRTPDTWLRASEHQSPDETMAALAAAISDEARTLEHRIERGGSDLLEGPSGRPVHWSIIPLHVFWDAWLHERDVILPSGGHHASTELESRLAGMYGLLVAAIPPLFAGSPLDTTVALSGAVHAVGIIDDEIVVMDAQMNEAALRGELATVVDALMGRGTEVGAALIGHSADADKLSWLSAFMNPRP